MNDVVGKTDQQFVVNALVGALARVIAEQDRRISVLEAGLASLPKRAKTASPK